MTEDDLIAALETRASDGWSGDAVAISLSDAVEIFMAIQGAPHRHHSKYVDGKLTRDCLICGRDLTDGFHERVNQ